MRTFYKKTNNIITEYCAFDETDIIPLFILEQYTETDQEIRQSVDGNLYFADEIDLAREEILKVEKAKVAKIASLKADRDRLEVEDIEVGGHLYDYDEKARERINNAIIALQASNGSILWTLADNNSVLVTAQDLVAVVSAVAVRSNALHIAYRDAKAKVNAAMTVEEVNTVELEV